jgi:hypothetical protein
MRLSTILIWLGGALGGALGGWLGGRLGIFGAYMVGLVGTAAGMFFTRRWARMYFP